MNIKSASILLLITLLFCIIYLNFSKETYTNKLNGMTKDIYKMISNTNKVQPYDWNKFREWLLYQTYTGGLCNKYLLTQWIKYRLNKYFGDKIQLVETKTYQPEMYVIRFVLVDRSRFEFGDGVFVLKTFWKRIGLNKDNEVWRLNEAILDTNNIYPIQNNQNMGITNLYTAKMNNIYDKQGYLRFEPTLPRPSINEYLQLTTKYNPTIPTTNFSKMCNTPNYYSNEYCLLTDEYKKKL